MLDAVFRPLVEIEFLWSTKSTYISGVGSLLNFLVKITTYATAKF